MAENEAQEGQANVQTWLNHIAQYEATFKKWEGRTEKIIGRYRDEKRDKTSNTGSKINILWSNVQTLVPACFSRLPQPDVSRRFRDNDPVGRVAALILERALDFEIQHYPDYRDTMRQAVLDRFLGGRGTAWIRYEPHILAKKAELPTDGVQVTEDIDEPQEELDYECAPLDYVHWKDFGHTKARTWEEVTAVWRVVYMYKDAVEERFGKEWADKLSYDATPDDNKRYQDTSTEIERQARIYEVWDKTTKRAIWLSKSSKEVLDERDDPLGLEGFFPCPKPLYATLTNETLVPVPDFTLYQDQANDLDILSDRIDGLIKALKIQGVYDSSEPTLARLFTEGENNELLPVKNWQAFAEKNGLSGAIDLVDLKPIYEALRVCFEAVQGIKEQIYDITGLSDIVRGVSQASETLGAQQIKQNFVGLRLGDMQKSVAEFATECLRLKAQVMCGKFSPDTLVKISAVAQLSPVDQQAVPQALQLLLGDRSQNPDAETPNPLRAFRIEVAADSLVKMDEQQEKQDRIEFLTAVGAYFEKALPVVQQAPNAAPIVVELLKFGITAFPVGKTIEGSLDQALDSLRQQPAQQKPDPEAMKAQAEQAKHQAQLQAEQQSQQVQMQADAQKHAAEMQARAAELQQTAALEQQRNQMEAEREAQKAQMQADIERYKADTQAQAEMSRIEFERYKVQLEAETRVLVAQIAADAGAKQAQISAENAAIQAKEDKTGVENPKDDTTGEALAVAIEGFTAALGELRRPRKVVRDEEGRMMGVE